MTEAGDVYQIDEENSGEPRLLIVLRDVHVTSIAMSTCHCLAITSNGAVFSWGDNSFGQLGLSLSPSAVTEVEQPTQIDSEESFGSSLILSAAAGEHHSVFLAEGALFSCGSTAGGRLGIGHRREIPTYVSSPHPVQMAAEEDATKPLSFEAVSVGVAHSFALTTDGKLYGWGSNDCGTKLSRDASL